MQAYSSSDDNVFLATYDALQQSLDHNFVFTQAQEQRATRIRRCNEAIERLHVALASKSPWRLIKAYDPVLDNSAQITARERELLTLARLLTAALLSGNDDQLLAADRTRQQSLQHDLFQFTAEEKQRFALAQQKYTALLKFRAALQSRIPRSLVAAYSTILENYGEFTQEEREQLAAVRLFVDAFDANDDEMLTNVGEILQKPVVRGFFLVTQQEQERIHLAEQRLQALEKFRQVLLLAPKDAHSILAAYDSSLLNASSAVKDEQREIVAAASQYLAMYEAVKTAIQADKDDLIRSAYNPTLAQRFTGIASAEQQRIDRAMQLQKLEDLLDGKEYEQALLMAQSIQKTTGQAISGTLTFKLNRATMRFIRKHNLSNLSIQIAEQASTNEAIVSWQWPITTLIYTALIVWEIGTWPDRPSEKNLNNPEWKHTWIRRKNNVLHSSTTIPVGKGTHIYVRGYAAMLDTWDQAQKWRFSDGDEPTSSAETTSPHIIWRVQ